MNVLTDQILFPPVDQTDKHGLLAIGGDLSPERLLLAYHSGIFPWYDDNMPIMWWSPDPRTVLFPHKFKVSKSLRNILNRNKFEVTFNSEFEKVIQLCANVYRKDEYGTWITPEMQEAYCRLHKLGFARSVEVWQNKCLVGGLYGIDLAKKGVFCGESMFSLVSNASKVAFYFLTQNLISKGYKVIDCQVYNPHLASLGAEEIPKKDFLCFLQ